MDLCGFLLVVLLILGFITLLGHGIWIFLAALGRAIGGSEIVPTGGSIRSDRRGVLPCPGCDNMLLLSVATCPHCDLDQGGNRAAMIRDLGAARRVLRKLASDQEINDTTATRLYDLLDQQKRQILGYPAPVVAPQPVEAPPNPVEEEILDAIPVPEPLPEPEPPSPALPPEPTPVHVALPPAPPPRPITTVMAGFLEERNILWGELVGGLLIVGCSIALVLTLWNSLQYLPYFPFLMFSGITAALFGAGLYTLHHWKLEATSRGLLVISLLLAPLNLLVLADPTARGDVPAVGWLHPLVVIASLAFFGWMVWGAGRDLIGADLLPGPVDRRWLLALAVVGTTGSQLFTPAFLSDGGPALATMLGLAAIPGACYLLTTGAVFGGLALYGRRERDLTASQAHALFSFLGLAVFALFAALAFLLSRNAHWLDTLPAMALPLALAGVPGLACGLFVHRQLGVEDAGTRTAGTAVTLAGLTVMLAGLGIAWPQPLPLLVVAIVNAAALTVAAFRGRANWLHAGGIPCLALAVLLVVADGSSPLVESLLSVRSGLTLALLVAGLAGLAIRLDRMGQQRHSVAYSIGAVCLAVVALFLSVRHGDAHPLFAAGIHFLLSLTALACCMYSARHWLAQSGAWLLLSASLYGLTGIVPGGEYVIWGNVLAAEGVLFLLASISIKGRRHPACLAFQSTGVAASVIALLLSAYAVLSNDSLRDPRMALTASLLSAQCFLFAWQTRKPLMSMLGSIFALLGLYSVVNVYLGHSAMPAALTLLAHATVATGVGWMIRGRREVFTRLFADPLWRTAEVSSLVAFGVALWPRELLPWRTGCALWAAGLWLERAWYWRSPVWFTLTQWGVSVALLFGVHLTVVAHGWFGIVSPLDPRAWQVYGTALGLLGLVWLGLRYVERLRPLWPKDANSLDRIGTGVLVLGQLALLGSYIVPGIAAEWTADFALDRVEWWTPETFGVPGWICLATLIVLLGAGLRGRADGEEYFRVASLGGLVLLAISAVLLWAGPFAEERATASALRWGLSVVFLAGSVILWNRESLSRFAWNAGFSIGARPEPLDLRRPQGESLFRALVGLSGVCVFLLSAAVAMLGFSIIPRGGPSPHSVFADLGFTLSNIGPLALLVIALAGNALRERSAGYASLACLLATLSVTAGYALSIPAIDFGECLILWLLATLTASFGALCWLLAGRRIPAGPLLTLQVRVSPVSLLLLAFIPLAWWLLAPDDLLAPSYQVLGSPFGWSALVLTCSAGFFHARRYDPPRQVAGLAITGLLAGVLAGCLALRWDAPGLGLGFGVLTLTWCYVGFVAVAAGSFCWQRERWPAGFAARQVCGWLAVIGAALALVALRGDHHPWRPWLPSGAALIAAGVLAAPALWFRRGAFTYASGLAVVLAGWLLHSALGDPTIPAFLLAIGMSLAIASVLWSLPEVRDTVPFSCLAAPLSLVLAACAVAGALLMDIANAPTSLSVWLASGTLVAVGIAFYLEKDTPVAGPGFYALLLTAFGLLLHILPLYPSQIPWAVGLALAVHFTLAAGIAWRFPDRLGWERGWFDPTQVLAGSLVVMLAVRTCLVPGLLLERLTGSLMLLLLVPGGWLLARSSGLSGFRRLAPAALASAVASLAWAIPAGKGADIWLERNAWLLLVVTTFAVAYVEWPAVWQALLDEVRPVGQALFGVSLVLTLVVVGQMMPLFDPLAKRTTLSFPAVLAFFVAVSGQFVTSLRMALVPEREPLGLTERGKHLYVYLAEILLVLLFVNARLNVPMMFSGGMVKYWPFFVMLIAFVGVGLSELFERRGLGVLSHPLRRTAVFLPLIPLLSFWARPPQSLIDLAEANAPGAVPFLNNMKLLPWNFDAHALVWFLAGGVYLTLALLRHSAGWALAAAMAANCALWATWAHFGLGFLSHPQIWLIPLGLIVLVAEHLERDRLTNELASTLRYLGICLIYVASTAELFLTGLGNSLWLPVFLAVLCVAGVLGGIWLRVKAFLFLGVSFLLLDIVTMIWHAAVNRAHTWVWWASGIVLGMAILALFALFEKRRNDVLRLLDDLRRWD